MITLNFGISSFPLTKDEAAYIAQSLINAVSNKPAASPAFNSGMHGHISVLGKKSGSSKQVRSRTNSELRSNPQQSDQVLTDC